MKWNRINTTQRDSHTVAKIKKFLFSTLYKILQFYLKMLFKHCCFLNYKFPFLKV